MEKGMMKRGMIIALVVLVLLIASWFYISTIKMKQTEEDIKKEIDELFSIKCKYEERFVEECIETYQPVCASVNVECITEPCDPVHETFGNSCFACNNPRVKSYLEGEC